MLVSRNKSGIDSQEGVSSMIFFNIITFFGLN